MDDRFVFVNVGKDGKSTVKPLIEVLKHGEKQEETVNESAEALKGLARARALATLLESKAKVGSAKGLGKAKIVKTILELREKLGFGNAVDPKPIAVETQQPKPADGEARVSTAHFFSVRAKGSTSRQKLNDAAWAILQRIEANPDAPVTDEDKLELAKYTGNGGGLVGPDGLKGSAYEYYTPKPIAEGIWDILKDNGFAGGKVLDPSAGTGIFGATAPLNAAVDAVELSEISGKINRIVNGGPGYTTTISPFERVAAATPDGTYDAVVTNVPFGEKADRGANYLLDDRYQDEPLENYFILRSLEKLRPNGMAAFIVPTRCISGRDAKQVSLRERASLMAEFVGGYRLPTGTFSSADTDTVTDVMFFRKFSSETAEKIEELRSQNPDVLAESKVVWEDFIEGKYFSTSEGHPYVLGEFVARDPNKFRDVDKVINGASLNELKDLMRTKKLPASRINWDLLNSKETDPIIYNDGDHITQAGVTLEMQNGVWVALPKSEKDIAKAVELEKLANPYKAFESGMTFDSAKSLYDSMRANSQALDIPSWLSRTLSGLSAVSEGAKTKYWKKALVALSVQQVLEERSGEERVDFNSEYKALTDAMRTANITQADTTRVGGVLTEAFRLLRIHYTKKNGYSDRWLGKIKETVSQSDAIVQAAGTPEAIFANKCYASQSRWQPIEAAKEVFGESFDPLTDDAWCVSADGKNICRVDDYFVGNYGEFLKRIDAEIETASDENLKAKLLRQRILAADRVQKVDTSRLTFNLHSPYVTAQEKVQFLKAFVTDAAVETTDENGRALADINIANTKTDRDKLLNRMGDYLMRGTISLGGVELSSMSEEDALAELSSMIARANEQFNSWVRSNKSIMSRMQRRASDPEKLRFVAVEDESELSVPGMRPELKLHGYQCAFVRKMGREFSGINGFGVGLGKAQPLDAKILTPNGWVRMGDVKVGDKVISRQGLPTTVTAIYPQGKKEIFEVVFSDGAKTRCCDEHLWLTQTENDRKKMAYHRSCGREIYIEGTPKLLKDIRHTLICCKKQKNHKIPMVHPVQFEERKFRIDPYVLGLILGDGGITANFASFTNSNEQIVSRFKDVLSRDFPDVVLKQRGDKVNEFRVSKMVADGCPNTFVQALKHYGLMGCRSEHKFVPDEYMLGSIEQRIELLRGLMDTDGYVSRDGITVQFNSASERLANAVVELVQSLGGIAWIKVKKTPSLDSHLVTIRMPAEINPFSLERKAKRVKPKSKYLPVRYIVAVNSIGEEEAQCIQVEDAEHLYVTDDYIVTHNTFTALAAVQHVQAIGVKKKTIFVVPNSVLSNWKKEAGRAYATLDDCLFVGLRTNKAGKNVVQSSAYDEDLHEIANNKHSKIFMTMEAFERIKLRDETIDDYTNYLRTVDNSIGLSESKKDDERKKGKSAGYAEILRKKTGVAPYLEDLGIDSLVIDEAHMYKNSAQTFDFKGAKYLPRATASRRGIDAQAKAWYIRGGSTLGDGVLLLTATPITNSPIEIYSMLSLAAGPERVNDACLGIHGADDFMETMCHKESEEYPGIDGKPKSGMIFTGLDNLGVLRKALSDNTTIKNADDVGASVVIPERDEKGVLVTMSDDMVDKLEKLKNAYRYAGALKKNQEPPIEYLEDFEEVQKTFGAPSSVIAHPFNLISKMKEVIADPELATGASFYQIVEGQEETARKVIEEFNAKKIKEERKYVSADLLNSGLVTEKNIKSDDDGSDEEKVRGYEVSVEAALIGSEIRIESTDFKTQNTFEEIAAKHGLDLDVHDSPKLAAMIENFKDEMAHPRGMIDEDTKSPIVKQIIFCDMLGLHSKIRRLLQKRCGISAGKIVIVTGQTNNTPEEIQAVQDGFNAQGEENRYQVVLANEKAEVGINLQKGTQAIHHLTIGWTPDSIEQRNGRGARQGNKTQKVRIYYYDADGSFDVLMRTTVNHKANWIENVTDLDGGDKVTVTGGLSNDDYDALIRSSGDPDAMRRYEEEKQRREALARAEGNRERQRINLDTIAKQVDFLKKYPDANQLAMERVGALWTLDNACAKLKKKTDKPNPRPADIKKLAAMQALFDAKAKEIDESITFFKKESFSGDETKPIDNAKAFLEEISQDWNAPKKAEDVVVKLRSWYGLRVDETSALYGEWQSAIDQANGMIDQSMASYEEQAKENGAFPSGIAQAVKDGDIVMYSGYPVQSGMFVRNGTELGILSIYGSGRCVVSFYDENGRSNSRDLNVQSHELVYEGTPGYTECLMAAAGIEDKLADEGETFAVFSQQHKDVGQYRKSETLVEYSCLSASLPAPYFPYVVTENEMQVCQTCAAIAKEQKAVVKAVDGYHFRVSSSLEVNPDDETGKFWSSARNEKFVTALVEWAKAHGTIVKYRWRMSGWDDYLSSHSDRIDMSRLRDAKTPAEVDQIAWAILNEAFPYVDFAESRRVDDAMPETLRYELQQIRKAVEPKEEIANDKIVGITGDTYPYKDDIKQLAQMEGERARWNSARKAWVVQYVVYKKLIERYPNAVNHLEIVAVA